MQTIIKGLAVLGLLGVIGPCSAGCVKVVSKGAAAIGPTEWRAVEANWGCSEEQDGQAELVITSPMLDDGVKFLGAVFANSGAGG